ncbi:hypothetical protein BC831DRAFT_509170 [Entophlyctis helioformis]|nr:hypothetical protein BC831DRAFT_509170 [Entophlyctis helioformis]
MASTIASTIHASLVGSTAPSSDNRGGPATTAEIATLTTAKSTMAGQSETAMETRGCGLPPDPSNTVQLLCNTSLSQAADVHEAIAFKTAKHADPNATAGERAFWDLRCRAYCSPFLNARKVKAKRFAMRSNSMSIRGNALEGIMKLAGSTTGERASAASQGRCDKPTEKGIPVVWAFGIDFTGSGGGSPDRPSANPNIRFTREPISTADEHVPTTTAAATRTKTSGLAVAT